MVEPLSVGKHTVSFGGTISALDFRQNNTYEISVVPVPEPTAIIGLLGLGLFMGISRRKQHV
ncbi:PEP-CTERM sorting domain-containing protein [Trichocoleus sp. FACHB-90]|nr:PEP-CTERM sorting domain-containing protein [Trichocoleus sp. FACHB-90]